MSEVNGGSTDDIEHKGGTQQSENALYRSNTNITLSPEQFEKLYLSPQNQTKGDLRKTFGNPTPL